MTEKSEPDLKERSDLLSKPTLIDSSRHMKNVILYGFIKSYGLIPINLISTLLLSRTLEVEYWATLLYGIVLISGSQIFLGIYF